MVDFNTAYRPPGVYIEQAATPIVPQVGSTQTVLAIVGPSRDYLTYSETVTLTNTDGVQLSKLGIIGSSVVVTSLDGVTTYAIDSDYTLTVDSGADESSTLDDTLTIARAAEGSNIENGTTVRVTYRFTDAAFYEPVLLNDYEDVKDRFGEPYNVETGAIMSPLSLAAKLAFDNGARQMILLAVPGTSLATREVISAAYTKLASLATVGIVVPLPVSITGTENSPGDVINCGTDLATHCANATEDGFSRIGIYGVESDVSIDASDIAASINSERVVLAWPNRMNFYNGYANQVMELPGYYLAAAYAGRLAALPAHYPLTKKSINGFVGIPSDLLATMTPTVKNAWSEAGVAVTELTRRRQLVVRHGTSTNVASAITREISVTRAKDLMVRTIQDTLDSAGFIGLPIGPTTIYQVKGAVQGVLEALQIDETIYSYRNVKGRLKQGDPQVIEIKFEYRPSYPLNYIVVSFSIDTATGDTEFESNLGQLV